MINVEESDEKKKSKRQTLSGRKKLNIPLADAGRSHASRKLRTENRKILDELKS